ncbi:MAG: discoidin domain-containing protein [Planctomycetota bacterium]
MIRNPTRCIALLLAAALATGGGLALRTARAQNKPAGQPANPDDKVKSEPAAPAADKAPSGDLVPLEMKPLPKPAFKGTPTQPPKGMQDWLEKPRVGPRPPLMVPKGVKLLSLNKPVTSSDSEPIIGTLKLVTDGDREAKEGSYVELGPKVQWVQIDLQDKYKLHALLFWHYHANARVYRDVVVQVSTDADFIDDVHTVFNNDFDNSAGLGIGAGKGYWETNEGKLLDAGGIVGRYVRLYSNGSNADDQNHYTEVEVYGLPAK